jgi:hypothetical protein
MTPAPHFPFGSVELVALGAVAILALGMAATLGLLARQPAGRE